MEAVMDKIGVEKYASYKDSGEQWIGEIPKHWEIKKLKHLFAEKKHTTNHTLSCGSISYGKVIVKDDEKIPLSTKASYQEVLKGEFLINPLNLNYDLISLRIALSNIDVVVSPGYIVLKNIAELNKDYFKYLLHRYDVAYMKLLGSGVRQTISFAHIANSFLLFPPIEEQTAVAAFLDRKTAQIDKVIAQKEKLIELLNERRQILIHKAVTRGLDPNVKMKDSGVEWIGEIPERWQIARVKQSTFKISKGTTPSTEGGSILDRGPIRYLKAENIQDGSITLSPAYYIDEKTNSLIKRSELKVNDVLFVIAGATLGKVAVISENETPSNTNQAVAFLRPNSKVKPKYLSAWLTSNIIRELTWVSAVQSAQPNLSMEELGNFPILLPDLEEQTEILQHIHVISGKVSKAVLSQEKEIGRLREYKATLINAAVTGKIKVDSIT